jgi:5,10-methylenetetrahydromethanopterin reductase
MERVGFCFLDRPSTSRQLALVQKIERLGYESAWVTETRLARDAFSVLGAFAAVTSRIKLCTGIVNSWTRGPALMAMTLATLDELAPGRVICGLGAYWDPLAWKQGIERSRPLEQMREYLIAVRRLLSLEEFTYEGAFVKLRDISLDLGHGAPREPKDVKLYIGPTGPQMTQLAGEIADGALLNGLLSPQYTKGMIGNLQKGMQKANRPADRGFEQPQLINISLSEDESRARETSRYLVTKYLGQQPHIGKAAGIEPELVERINKIMGGWPARPGGIEDAMKLVSDELTDSLTISGNEKTIKDRLNEWMDAGITYPVLLPLSENYDEIVDKLAPGKS